MKLGLGRMALRVKFAFVLAVTLLLPGVTPMSLERSVERTDHLPPSVANGTEVDAAAEKEVAMDEYELEYTEPDSNEVGLTPLDDSMHYVESILPDEQGMTESPQDAGREETNAERGTNLRESPKDNNRPEVGVAEDENLIGLDENDEAETDPLDFIRRIVKRAAEYGDEADEPGADEPEIETINEDDFSFSDLPKILGPLIQAFSGSPESEAPSSDDFFSWFPGLRGLLQPNKEEPSAAKPTDLPTNSITHSARRSGSPTSPELSLQIAPASSSAQPAESEALPSPPSLLEELVTPVPPTLPAPPQTSQPPLSDVPDSEEVFY